MFHLGSPTKAACRHRAVGDTHLRSRGDFDVLPPWSSVSWEDDDATEIMSIWISQFVIDDASAAMSQTGRRSLHALAMGQRDDQLFQLALILQAEMVADSPSDPLFIDSLGAALASKLLARYGLSDGPVRARLSRRKLDLIVDYIDDNISREIGLEDLSKISGLSSSRLRVLFRYSAGAPLHQYVLQRRVNHARRLLETGNVSLSEAALDSGFCDQSHMARWMRRLLGCTPTQLLADISQDASADLA